MMPGEISQSPGKDSMGMDMVPVYEEADGAAAPGTSESSVISIDPVTIQNMGIRTGEVTRGPLRRSIQTVGIVDYDETALRMSPCGSKAGLKSSTSIPAFSG